MFFDGKNHQLFKELVSHEELFGGSRDVSIVVKDSHTSESSNVDLHGDISGKVSMNLGLFGGVNSWVESCTSIVKALVSDFIDHLFISIFIIISFKPFISH